MSNKSTLRYFVVLLFAAFSSAALVLAAAGPLGQNTNSSTTEESAQNDNATMKPAPRRGRRGRRGTRRPAAADANANMAMEPGTMPETSGATAAAQDDDSRGDLSGEKVDLSGTYSGRIKTTGGHEMSGDAELAINGSTFTLTGEGMTHNGRIYAVLTRGATSAALYFADIQDSATSTPVVFNVRARKRGERLTLTPAPFTKNKLTFTPRGRR